MFISMYRQLFSSVKHHFINSTRNSHKLSYVQWARKLQGLKNDDQECSMCIPDGQFLLYVKNQPLLEPFQPLGNIETQSLLDFRLSPCFDALHGGQHPPLQIAWLTYPEIRDLCMDIFVSNVLVTLSTSGVPIYAVQVDNLDPDAVHSLLPCHMDAAAQDLRISLFTVAAAQAALLTSAFSLLSFHRKTSFCSSCGNKTKRNAAGNQRRCDECKNNIYPNSRPVGIVLVTDQTNSRALLVRPKQLPPNMYTCISGFADAGETIEECVRREIAEESGIEVDNVRYVGSQHWPYPGSLMAGCMATASTEQVLLDEDELESGGWFSRAEVTAALELARSDPMPWLHRAHAEDGTSPLLVPPPMTIANCLLTHWVYSS